MFIDYDSDTAEIFEDSFDKESVAEENEQYYDIGWQIPVIVFAVSVLITLNVNWLLRNRGT